MGTYDALELDLRRDIAVSLELSHGGRPGRRVGCTSSDILWDAITGEPPNSNSLSGDLSSVNTTQNLVKSRAIGCRVIGANSASRIGVLVWCGNITVRSVDDTREVAVVGNAASGARVQSNAVGGLVVDTLDDINLAVVGPVRADSPARS